jgi:hypothetical protein
MPNRMLRDWTDSDKVNSLTVYAERLFTRLIMKVDDYGCYHANPTLLRANLFPLLLSEVREADITRWMAECQKAGVIRLYEFSGKKYLEIQDFKQRLDKSSRKFPEPPKLNGSVSTVNESLTTSTEFRGELELEARSNSPNGLGKPGGLPNEFSDYQNLDKNARSVYDYIRNRKPTIPEPYVDLWNLFAEKNKVPQVQKLNDSRKRKLKARLKEKGFNLPEVLRKAGQSSFILQGTWFTFDWIIDNDKNYMKVLEGNYDPKAESRQSEVNPTNEKLKYAGNGSH